MKISGKFEMTANIKTNFIGYIKMILGLPIKVEIVLKDTELINRDGSKFLCSEKTE